MELQHKVRPVPATTPGSSAPPIWCLSSRGVWGSWPPTSSSCCTSSASGGFEIKTYTRAPAGSSRRRGLPLRSIDRGLNRLEANGVMRRLQQRQISPVEECALLGLLPLARALAQIAGRLNDTRNEMGLSSGPNRLGSSRSTRVLASARHPERLQVPSGRTMGLQSPIRGTDAPRHAVGLTDHE